MSSEATGWVLRHGPKERAMRMILLTIAEACNRDGEHGHPGMAGIIEGSLYCRAHVYRTIDKLIREGWLTVEEEGGGRGKATVFAIPGVSAGRSVNRPTVRTELKRKGPIPPPKQSHRPAETVPSEGASPCSATVGNNQPQTSAPKMPENPVLAAEARACAQFAFEQTPQPVSPFLAVQARCTEALRAGHTPDDLRRVIAEGDVTWTRAALEYRLGQSKAAPRQPFARDAHINGPDAPRLADAVARTLNGHTAPLGLEAGLL